MGPHASTAAVPEDSLVTCTGGVHSWDPPLPGMSAVVALHAPACQAEPEAVNSYQGGAQQLLAQHCQNKGAAAVPPHPCQAGSGTAAGQEVPGLCRPASGLQAGMAPLSPSFLLGLRGEPEGFGSCKQL